MEIQGKVALVTGGASGIGLATVKELLKQGAKVLFCDVNEKLGEQEAKALREQHKTKNVIFKKCDITKKEEFEDCFKKAVSEFGGLDILFNNAGIIDEISWEKMYDINIRGTTTGILLGMKYLGKDKLGKGGVIVNTASVAGLMAFSVGPMYCATKHAIIGLSRSFGMADHLERTGVRVVALCPAQTATNIIQENCEQKLYFKKEALHVQKLLAEGQCPSLVAEAVMKIIREAKNGSALICEEGKLTEFQFGTYDIKGIDPELLH